jgi:hypothetical protein
VIAAEIPDFWLGVATGVLLGIAGMIWIALVVQGRKNG